MTVSDTTEEVTSAVFTCARLAFSFSAGMNVGAGPDRQRLRLRHLGRLRRHLEPCQVGRRRQRRPQNTQFSGFKPNFRPYWPQNHRNLQVSASETCLDMTSNHSWQQIWQDLCPDFILDTFLWKYGEIISSISLQKQNEGFVYIFYRRHASWLERNILKFHMNFNL